MACRTYRLITVLLFLRMLPASLTGQQSVVFCPDRAESLSRRWAWAEDEATQAAYRNGFWIGYHIERWMGERSFTGSYSWPPREDEPTLNEVLFGIEVEDLTPEISDTETIRRTAKAALELSEQKRRPEKKVLKKVAILFRYRRDGRRDTRLEALKMSNLSLHVDLKDLPVLWLGGAEDPESIMLLDAKFSRAESDEQKERFVSAIGIHDDADAVIPPLRRILTGSEPDEVREQAAFWLGQQDDERVFPILMRTAKTDASGDVREKAVFAISQVELPEAVDHLVELAKNARDREVQEKAVFWLGQTGDPKALTILLEIARSDNDAGLREKAVFGLYQIENEDGIEALIDLAYKSRHRNVREKSIF